MRFAFRIPVFIVLLTLALGCGSAKQTGDPETMRKQAELGEIYDSYTMFAKKNQRPPKQISELMQKEYQAVYSVGLSALKSGQYVAVWGVDVNGKDGGTVLAYEKNAAKEGGAVLMANGTIKQMTADELQSALKSKG
jgi:hypothetical protein